MVKDYYTRSEVDYFVQTTGSTDTADTQKAALYLTALLYTFPGITNVYVGSSTALGGTPFVSDSLSAQGSLLPQIDLWVL